MHDSTKIRREVSKLYDKDPEGWKVLVGKDNSGFFDVLISHKDEGWQIKEYQVNPYKYVGLGSRLPRTPVHPIATETHAFGLRPVGIDQMKELAGLIDDPKSMNDVLLRLLQEKPITSREIVDSAAVLQGPILQSTRPLEALSTAHTKLDEKLRKELQQLVRRDFRHTLTPYV
jgi:hypothetical protein